MHKLLLLTLMAAVWAMLVALQVDEEMSIRTLFEAKRAVNRAAHAAAQQVDEDALAAGVVHIDKAAAASAALRYLQTNLRLDSSLAPLPGSMLRDPVKIAELRVVNGNEHFPYTYRNEVYDYEVTLRRPGVILIVRVRYPRGFSVMDPIEVCEGLGGTGAARLSDAAAHFPLLGRAPHFSFRPYPPRSSWRRGVSFWPCPLRSSGRRGASIRQIPFDHPGLRLFSNLSPAALVHDLIRFAHPDDIRESRHASGAHREQVV